MFFNVLLGLPGASQQGHKSWPHSHRGDRQQPSSWLPVAPWKSGLALASHHEKRGAKTQPEASQGANPRVFAQPPSATFELLTKNQVIFLEKLHQIPHASQQELKARASSSSNLLSPAFQTCSPRSFLANTIPIQQEPSVSLQKAALSVLIPPTFITDSRRPRSLGKDQ